MENIFILFTIVFLAFCVGAETKNIEYKVFKNNRCGYELNYPNNWLVDSGDEVDDYTNLIPSAEVSQAVIFYLKDKSTLKSCKYNEDCLLGIDCYGDGTDKKLKDATNFINNHIKYEYGRARKTKIQEIELSGNKAEIVLRESGRESYKAAIYLQCEKAKRILCLSAARRFNTIYENFYKLVERPVILENLFNSDQLMIINSFRCPEKNFVYKKEKLKKKKTK